MKKVLVIDDNAAARQMTVEMLRKSGHEVLEAGNEQSGLELVRHCLINLEASSEMNQDPDLVDALVNSSSNGNQNVKSLILAGQKLHDLVAIKNLVLENSILGFALVRNRYFVWANRRLAELLDMPLEKIQGASTRVIYPSDEAFEALGRLAYPALANGGQSDSMLQLKRSDGSLFWCRFIGKALDTSSPQAGSIWMFEDITQRKQAEEKLRLQTSALEAAAIGIMITDRASHILWVNPAFTQLTGYGAEEVAGRTPAMLKSARHKSPFYQNLWNTILAGNVWHGELTNRRKDGSEYQEEMTITPVHDEQGRIQNFIAFKQDISQRKKIERDLARERDLLQSLMDNLPDYIYFKDVNSRFTRINLAHARHLGLNRPEEAIGKSDSDFFPNLAARQKYVEEQRLLTSGEPMLGFIEEAETARGKSWVSSTKVPLRDADGRITGLVGISRDITKLQCAEEAVRESEARYHSLFGNMLEGFARCQMLFEEGRPADFIYLEVNRAFETLTGLKEVVGKKVSEVIPGFQKFNPELIDTYGRVALTGKPERIETYVAPLKIWFSIAVYSYQIGHFVAIFDNITASKQAEDARQMMEIQLRQAQKLEAIGQLAAGIAHEINTPTQYVGDNTRFLQDAFNSISTVLRSHEELLAAAKQKTLTPELLEQAGKVLAASDLEYLCEQVPSAIAETLDGVERVTRIVRAMKEFSHPGGKEKAAADLNKAIESTITVARNEWKYVADLKTDFAVDLPFIPCFIGEFNQCILNLIVNAAHAIGDVVKKNPGTKGLITISTRHDGDYIEVRVADTGTGIAEMHRPHIFEPFFTTKDVGRGTGQGLALVYNSIVQKHEGTVMFETETGKGTTFILRLPVNPKTITPPPERRPATEGENPSIRA